MTCASSRNHQDGPFYPFLLLLILWTLTTSTAMTLQPASNSLEPHCSIHPPTIEILLETDRILVIHKPDGISHHNDGNELGVLSHLRRQLLPLKEENPTSNPQAPRFFGVHRLDRVTSGILVLAKDAPMAAEISTAFRNSQVVKYYVGISAQKPKKKKQGWVKGAMERGRRKSWYLSSSTTTTTTTSKSATSSNTITTTSPAITRFFSAGLGSINHHQQHQHHDDDSDTVQLQPKTLLLFRPYTGKTHQLRVAAKSLGLPLLGDPIYSSTTANSSVCDDTTAIRTFLHATAIHIPLQTHDNVTLWCPPTFASNLWDEQGTQDFHHILYELMIKHCDCPEIMELLT